MGAIRRQRNRSRKRRTADWERQDRNRAEAGMSWQQKAARRTRAARHLLEVRA